MKRTRLEEKLYALAEPQIEALGYRLWGLLAPAAGNKTVVSVFIDADDGVNVDDCAKVSRDLGVVLEMEDVVPSSYTLEVSSPGLERRFFHLEQMRGFIDRTVAVELTELVNERRKIKGRLVQIGDGEFELEENGAQMRIEWQWVKSARLVHEF
ncbi:ribosome maturation factor RimP [Paucidesulfovibrio longus]|uniref:ribosome maturation factor RimP n=1 Tax=Paucidesulfovibrio longus TaxID=889 RepID=UPI0003B5A262|nr:ribosome maturation factor RimP [Paucidesulfovibrio longus]